jgi:hypothetical protein
VAGNQQGKEGGGKVTGQPEQLKLEYFGKKMKAKEEPDIHVFDEVSECSG